MSGMEPARGMEGLPLLPSLSAMVQQLPQSLARIPVVCIDYLEDDSVELELWPASDLESITKQEVIDMALSSNLYPPKTTRHRISDHLPPIHVSLERLSLLTPSRPDANES